MKKKRAFLLPLLIFGLVGLSACSLFDDDDIAVHNEYNPAPEDEEEQERDPNATYVQNVKARENQEKVPNAYLFKSIPYGVNGLVPNTYKEGGVNENEFNVNGGQDYKSTKSNNNYDLYVPKAELKDSKHVVILFIHGGAWVSGFKADVEPFVYEFVNKGYITANIKYTLLKRTMDDSSLSIFRNLDEIDACVTNIKVALHELFENKGVQLADDQLKLVIGGASSGAHLAMLYTYSRGQNAALKPQLVVDAVGPTDMKPNAWKRLSTPNPEHGPASIEKDSGNSLTELVISGEKDSHDNDAKWNDYQTMRIANGMCGVPYSLETVRAATEDEATISDTTNEAYKAMTKPGGGEDQLSVTHYMSATNKYKMICAYAGMDSVVGVNQFANLQTAMDTHGISYSYIYFQDCNHTDLNTKESEHAAYEAFLNQIETDCNALLA